MTHFFMLCTTWLSLGMGGSEIRTDLVSWFLLSFIFQHSICCILCNNAICSFTLTYQAFGILSVWHLITLYRNNIPKHTHCIRRVFGEVNAVFHLLISIFCIWSVMFVFYPCSLCIQAACHQYSASRLANGKVGYDRLLCHAVPHCHSDTTFSQCLTS